MTLFRNVLFSLAAASFTVTPENSEIAVGGIVSAIASGLALSADESKGGRARNAVYIATLSEGGLASGKLFNRPQLFCGAFLLEKPEMRIS